MRIQIAFLLITLPLHLCLGCQGAETAAERQEAGAEISLEEQNKELARQYIATINSGNFEALENLLAEDFEIYSPSAYPEPNTRQKLIEGYKATKDAFSDFTWTVQDMVAAGDKVVCRVIVTGRFKGASDVPADPGQEFRFGLITIMRAENGKVVEEWQEDDQLGFARQLGMELAPQAE